FHELTNGYNLSFDLQGCTNSTENLRVADLPGTYRVSVDGSYSNLPGTSVVVLPSLAITANTANVALDVKTVTVSGTVTLNGVNPVSNVNGCSVSTAGTYEPRGQVYFHELTNGYNLSFDLQGCTN